MASTPAIPGAVGTVDCPLTLTLDVVTAMLNFEFPDHPVYDSGELLWFDDAAHGTGMMAFLRRRADRRVDYYPESSLRLNREDFYLGGGIGAWSVTDFAASRLRIARDGVLAEARFTDVDGRAIEIHIDDRDGSARRRCGLLAPVGDDIEHPSALLLVWLPRFDLVRRGASEPVIRIDGQDVAVVQVPGPKLHRRHIIKYSTSLCTIELARAFEGTLGHFTGASLTRSPDGREVTGISARGGQHRAQMIMQPGLPDVRGLAEGEKVQGRWHVRIDDARLTGGRWFARRDGATVRMGLDVDERWRPGWLPSLMRFVVRVVPAFRRWPTTYRWRAELRLGQDTHMSSTWERIAGES